MRPLRVLAALLLVTVGIAGCLDTESEPASSTSDLTAALPNEQFTEWTQIELDFTASDGTYIHGTAYLPGDGSGEFGTVLNFSPYYTNLYGIDTDGRLNSVASGDLLLNQSSTGLFVSHGFAFVAASVPGTGQSTGCFGLGGEHEQTTMAEFVDWVGTQDWSNGNVGMYGASYDGTTQWMVGVQAPQALKTIVPWVSITDFYEYEYVDGAPYAWYGPMFLPYYLLEVGWNAGTYTRNPTFTAESIQHDACDGFWDQFVQAEKTYATGVYDDWWQERNYGANFANLNASVLMIQGMQDWNVKPLHLEAWDAVTTEKVLWLQQMNHNVPYRNSHEEDWIRRDYNATLLAWYDHYLNGVDNGVPDVLPNVWVQDHTGNWRTEEAWPSPRAEATTFHIGAEGLTQAPADDGVTTFATMPSWTGLLVEPDVGTIGPDSPSEFVAKFSTGPLVEDMRISGTPTLDLQLSVDRPGYAHLVAQLWILHEDGTQEWIDYGSRGLAQRNDRTNDDAVMPMESMEIAVRFNPTETFVPSGAEVVLLLSGDDPALINPNGHAPIWFVDHNGTVTLPLLTADVERGMTGLEVALENPFWSPGTKEWAQP